MPFHATSRSITRSILRPRSRVLGTLLLVLGAIAFDARDGVRATAVDDGPGASTRIVVVEEDAATIEWRAAADSQSRELHWGGDAAPSTLLGPGARRTFAAGAFELDPRARAAAALRHLERAPLGFDVASIPTAGLAVDLVASGPDERGGSDESARRATWFRPGESAPTLWWPLGEGADASLIALGPAFAADVERVAAHLLGLELLATHRAETWERVRAAHVEATGRWVAAPGELWMPSRAALDALCDEVRDALFGSVHIQDAQARMWDDGTLVVGASLDGARLGELLFTCGQTPAAVGTALRTLTPERFFELHRELWDVDRWRTVRLAATAPNDDGAFDLSRSAWEQGTDAGRTTAERLLSRIGGADAWSGLRAVRLETTSRTSTQLDDQVADAVTVRVLSGGLTHVAQQMEVQGTVQSFTTTIAGDTAWIESGSRLIVPEDGQLARLLAGERRSLVRLLPRLAGRRDVGARLDDDGHLVLFDAHAVLGTLELDGEGELRAFRYSDGTSTRHFTYDDAVDFDGLRYPGTYREVGGRGAEIVITDLVPLTEVEPSLFADPRR